ncbi:MAG TPA: hypothetical protein VFW94_05440 [Candidatus Acidoferrales bacterium]|nr:hypothetical protein [Candidatus Acidoferrales bacterium]
MRATVADANWSKFCWIRALYYTSYLNYNFKHMKTTVQARLDRRSQMALERLTKRLGWSPSRVVREGVRLLDACYGKPRRRKIVGIGRFASGIPDLGSNKEHLKGLGR